MRFILLLSFILGTLPAWASEYTVYDRDYRTQYHIRDGKIYDGNWQRVGSIKEAPDSVPRNTVPGRNSGDRRILDRNYKVKGYIKSKGGK